MYSDKTQTTHYQHVVGVFVLFFKIARERRLAKWDGTMVGSLCAIGPILIMASPAPGAAIRIITRAKY